MGRQALHPASDKQQPCHTPQAIELQRVLLVFPQQSQLAAQGM
jgi:hypothetical protein